MSAWRARRRQVATVGLVVAGLAGGSAIAVLPAQAAPARALMSNGSAESVARQVPRGWTKAGFGTNTHVLTSATGGAQSGRHYVRTKITKYRSGAAWWSTPAAAVRGGTTYTYSEYYRSGSPTSVNAYFTVRGKVVGQRLAAVPVSGRWKAFRVAVSAPAGATAVRFGHALTSAGYVDVDNASLVAGGTATPPAGTAPSSRPPVTAPSTKGLVSLTFDDGWANQVTNAAPILKAAGMPGTSGETWAHPSRSR
jgi:hypothetical protein